MPKTVCLECQSYHSGCRPGCSQKQLYIVSYAFRPPRRGSKKWKLIAKLIRQNCLPDSRISPSFSTSGGTPIVEMNGRWVGVPRAPKAWREAGYLRHALGLD